AGASRSVAAAPARAMPWRAGPPTPAAPGGGPPPSPSPPRHDPEPQVAGLIDRRSLALVLPLGSVRVGTAAKQPTRRDTMIGPDAQRMRVSPLVTAAAGVRVREGRAQRSSRPSAVLSPSPEGPT